MFFIGRVKIKNRVLAAPMAGVTDKANRIIARSFGCGLAVSEMISDMGLVYGQKRTLALADHSGEAGPAAMQIFGSRSEPMARGARVLEELGADIIDINMGCPTPKIIKNGEGAALMLDLKRSREIIRAVVQAVQVPVTIKMRLGWDDEDTYNFIELAGIAEQEGAQAVTLHARSRSQFYSGQANWNMIKKLKQQIRIPVVGNGDIWKAEDALRMIEETGCDAVMIGRAAMGNPFIFRETEALLDTGMHISPPETEERIQVAIRQLDLACRFKGEGTAIREMRKHFAWYIKGLRGAAKIREEINLSRTREELVQAIQQTLSTKI